MSRRPFSSPGVNIEFKPVTRIYSKAGVQRSVNPRGPDVEHNQNSTGFRFRAPGDGWMVLGEAGYDTGLVPGELRTWIRGVGQYNWSSYIHFNTGHADRGNWCAYLFADHQLTQTDSRIPIKGIYVGGTYAYAPSKQNVFSQYYEARIYGFGLFPTRDLDQWEVSVDYNKWSPYASRCQQCGRHELRRFHIRQFRLHGALTPGSVFRSRGFLHQTSCLYPEAE